MKQIENRSQQGCFSHGDEEGPYSLVLLEGDVAVWEDVVAPADVGNEDTC